MGWNHPLFLKLRPGSLLQTVFNCCPPLKNLLATPSPWAETEESGHLIFSTIVVLSAKLPQWSPRLGMDLWQRPGRSEAVCLCSGGLYVPHSFIQNLIHRQRNAGKSSEQGNPYILRWLTTQRADELAAIYKSCIIIHAQILHNGNRSETTQPKSDSTFCIPYCSAISVLEIKNPRPWPFKRFPPPSVELSSWQHDFQLYLFKQAHP